MTYFALIDFNLRQTSDFCQGFVYAHREIRVFSTDGAPVTAHVPTVRSQTKYPSFYPKLKFSHLDQFLSMAFSQLTYCESLCEIETCLRAHQAKLYHLGIRGNIACSTLADANESRDCLIYEAYTMSLIQTALRLKQHLHIK